MERTQTASMEDYLEAVAMLGDEGRVVRVKQISQTLGVKMPSVISALKKLSREGLVKHERYGYVELTAEGSSAAADVIRRHQVLCRFLTELLGIDSQIADEDACRVEHVLSRESLERLAKFTEFVSNHPQGKPKLLKGFNYYLQHGERDEKLLVGDHREDSGKGK